MFLNLKESDLNKYIYRVISLERLLELFTTKKNTLVKPELWEDTFENFILKQKVKLLSGKVVEYNIHDRIFGQCWTFHNASDAMWRIYSPNNDGIRIRTKVSTLLESLYIVQEAIPEAKCSLGKVEYLSDKGLMDVANSTFDDSGISVDNIFRSLLIKRKAFKHENEVRLLFDSWDVSDSPVNFYRYSINPHKLISQIMIDPRRSYSEFKTLKNIIQKATDYKGPIKRSLLYAMPEEKVLNVSNILG